MTDRLVEHLKKMNSLPAEKFGGVINFPFVGEARKLLVDDCSRIILPVDIAGALRNQNYCGSFGARSFRVVLTTSFDQSYFCFSPTLLLDNGVFSRDVDDDLVCFFNSISSGYYDEFRRYVLPIGLKGCKNIRLIPDREVFILEKAI